MIAIDPNLYTYLLDGFIEVICQPAREYAGLLSGNLFVCPATNRNVRGVPELKLHSRFTAQKYLFRPKDFFIFGTHEPTQSTSQGMLGLDAEANSSDLRLGSLFVQKYGLRIEYLPLAPQMDNRRPSDYRVDLGYLYSRTDTEIVPSTWRTLVMQALAFSIVCLLLYNANTAKVERLEREKKLVSLIYDEQK